jgi:FkbM family methyltransferase
MTDKPYAETINCHDLKVPYFTDVISERMHSVLASGRYEKTEIQLLRNILRKGDRVLELGAGVGVVSAVAAQTIGAENVTAVEANPGLIPVIKETHRLNGFAKISLIQGAAVPNPTTKTVPFYQRENFWASSLDLREGEHASTQASAETPLVDLNALLKARQPTVIVIDIEGGELGIFDGVDLAGVRSVIMELHPRVYGLDGVNAVFTTLSDQGFTYDCKMSRGGTVVTFSRYQEAAKPPARVTAITCMKDEGPFILEWIAYHKSIGITDFVIMTNDCADGTVALLDHLDDLGIVSHYPNPASALGSQNFQPVAIAYAQTLKQVRDADWVISMDVDEFINIHVGDGTLASLFANLPDADAISLTHLDFGCSGQEKFESGFVTSQMQACAEKIPVKNSRRGIKTLVGKTAKIERLANHRPVFTEPEANKLVWYDGGGRTIPMKYAAGKNKGFDCWGSYTIAQLNHYPVKSMETFLVKSAKGDVVSPKFSAGIEYWVKRNHNDDTDTTILPKMAAAHSVFDDLLADPETRQLHEASILMHREQIAKLRQTSEMKDLLAEMTQNETAEVAS